MVVYSIYTAVPNCGRELPIGQKDAMVGQKSANAAAVP